MKITKRIIPGILWIFIHIISVNSMVLEKGIKFFPANDPLIRYTGRIDFSDPLKPRFWTPGVYIQASFVGSYCAVIINDEVKWGSSHNYLEIVLDGIERRIQTHDRTDTIVVAENLPMGEHSLLICKNTEVNIGYIEFAGLLCQGLGKLPEAPSRKMEFIGNSITCGTGGDLSQIPCGKGQWHDQHNAYLSYGPLLARKLKAQWHLTSYSGIGLIHSCCNIPFTMPMVFDRINLTPDQPKWDFKRYIPDVVTICLGQNDGLGDSAKYEATYISFIQFIRTCYPNAQIVCLTSPMGDSELTAGFKRYISRVVEHVNKQGDLKVHKFFFSRRYNSGCDSHPDLREHQLIASELEPFLKEITGW